MFTPYTPELIEEMASIHEAVGFPMLIVAKNVNYLKLKYKPAQKDFKQLYKYVNLNVRSINAVGSGQLKSVSVLWLCIFVNFFNIKYSAGLSIVDMFIDLEARERLQNF